MCHKICSKSKVYDQHNQADIPPKWCWVAHNKCYWGTCVLLIPPTDYTCSHISCNRWPSCIQRTFALPGWPAMAIFISDDLRLGFNSSFSRSHNSIHRKENQALIGCQRHTSAMNIAASPCFDFVLLQVQVNICNRWSKGDNPNNHNPEDPAFCKLSSGGTGHLQMISQMILPLANDHLEDLASCKWSSGGMGPLQMIIRHPCHPSHLCQDQDLISGTFLKQFVLVLPLELFK